MGSIEKLPSQRYRAYAWNAAAQRKEKVTPDDGSKTFIFWEEADAAVQRRERQIDGAYIDAGVPVRRQRTGRFRFAEVVSEWLPLQRGELQTRTAKKSAAKALNRTFAEEWFDEIAEEHVLRWLAEHEQQFAPSTVKSRVSALRSIFAHGVKQGMRADNPCEDIELRSGTRLRHPRYLTDEEMQRVRSFLPWWLQSAPLLAFDSGLRKAEFLGLRWFRLEIDTDEPEVDVVDVLDMDHSIRAYPKGKVPSRIPLTLRTAEALRELRDRTSGGRMDFVHRSPATGNAPSLAYAGTLWQQARTAAGLIDPPVTWHHLRHACARRLALGGASAMEIQALLRHDNLSTSQRYLDEVAPRQLRGVMTTVLERNAATPPLAPVA